MMKKFIALFIAATLLLCLFTACNKDDNPDHPEKEIKYGKVIYVATNGSDENDGSEKSPVATIYGAVKKLGEYKSANGLPDGGIKIEFAEGTYSVIETINLTEELSGEEEKPIVFAPADGANVVFDGGIVLNNEDFKPVTDEAVLATLKTDDARSGVLCLDLSKPEYSALFNEGYNGFLQTLSADGDIQTIARWPNYDEYQKAEIIENEGDYSVIAVTNEQVANWSASPTFSWFGYGRYDWRESRVSDEIIFDTERNAICIPNSKVSYYPVLSNMPYFVYDILCELDEPGEYYRDNENKLLYYWPSTDLATTKLSISANPGYGFDLENAEYITVKDIVFVNYCTTPIYGNTNNFSLIDCTISCCGDYPVKMNGNNNTFDGNTMFDLAQGGFNLTGGDFGTLEMSNTSVTNNHVYHFGMVGRTYTPAVRISGVGFYVAHNEIHDAPHNAIQGSMAQTIIEYNEIYDVVKCSSDAGAFYTGRTWTEKGTIIRYNYFHDIHDELFGGGPLAVYYDDTLAMQECYCNIFVNVGGSAIGASGRNITAYNNVCVNTYGIGIDGRGFSWYPTVTSYPGGLWAGVVGENYLSDLWRYATPELVTVIEMRTTEELKTLKGITDDLLDSPAPPAYCIIKDNIGYNSSPESTIGSNFVFNRNRYFRQNEFVEKADGTDPIIFEAVYRFGTVANNLDYTENPEDVFADPENGNFFLKEDSIVYRDIVGFEKWDYSLIGIQK